MLDVSSHFINTSVTQMIWDINYKVRIMFTLSLFEYNNNISLLIYFMMSWVGMLILFFYIFDACKPRLSSLDSSIPYVSCVGLAAQHNDIFLVSQPTGVDDSNSSRNDWRWTALISSHFVFLALWIFSTNII